MKVFWLNKEKIFGGASNFYFIFYSIIFTPVRLENGTLLNEKLVQNKLQCKHQRVCNKNL